MQITLTAIKDTERTSQRTGKPFTSRGIRCNEYGEKWLSGFAGKENASWKVGDTVEVTVEQKGEYLNFSVPKSERASGGMSSIEYQTVLRDLQAIKTDTQMIIGMIEKRFPSKPFDPTEEPAF